MNYFRRLVVRGAGLPLFLVLLVSACSSSQGEKSESEAEALTCPKGYHSACDGTRTPSGQCIGAIACQDANGNWAVADHNPKCGQIGQVCCPSPIDGPSCYAGFCNGGAGGTCTACGLVGQIACGTLCNAPGVYPNSSGICTDCTVPNTYVDNSTCQSCTGITFATPTPSFPRYWASTLTQPPLGANIMTTTGPVVPNAMAMTHPPGYTVPNVSLHGSDGSVLWPNNSTSMLFSGVLMSTIGGPPETYTEVMSYGNCAVPAPTTFTMPLGDAVGVVGACHYPVQVGNNGGGSMPGPATIVPILWGWGSPGPQGYGAELDAIYQQIAQSKYYAWIRQEYGAPELRTVPTTFTQAPFPGHLSSDIYRHDLDADLNAMVYSNVVPEPDNAIYAIHLAPGVRVYTDNAHQNALCSQFLGYNTKSLFTNTIYGWGRHYILIPDPSTCPGANIDQVTWTISHEIVEKVTDPDVGSGWLDLTQSAACGSQLGDLCANLPQLIRTPVTNPVTGSNNVVVQKIWSNKMQACVTENALNVPLE